MSSKTDQAVFQARDLKKPLFQGLIRGMLPLYLLIVLRDRPRHGTDLIRSLEAMSSDSWRPSPGSVYPVLRRLEKEGLLSGRWQRGQAAPKRVYRLTPKGQEAMPDLQADLVDQLRTARTLIDTHLEALVQISKGAHLGSSHGSGSELGDEQPDDSEESSSEGERGDLHGRS